MCPDPSLPHALLKSDASATEISKEGLRVDCSLGSRRMLRKMATRQVNRRPIALAFTVGLAGFLAVRVGPLQDFFAAYPPDLLAGSTWLPLVLGAATLEYLGYCLPGVMLSMSGHRGLWWIPLITLVAVRIPVWGISPLDATAASEGQMGAVMTILDLMLIAGPAAVAARVTIPSDPAARVDAISSFVWTAITLLAVAVVAQPTAWMWGTAVLVAVTAQLFTPYTWKRAAACLAVGILVAGVGDVLLLGLIPPSATLSLSGAWHAVWRSGVLLAAGLPLVQAMTSRRSTISPAGDRLVHATGL